MAFKIPMFDITLHKMVCRQGDFSQLYELSHVNGQIMATFKRANHHKRGTEIFIKNLAPDVLLQEIFDFVYPMGHVYQIRILLEFSGYCRGYCYVNFFEVESARKAMIVLCGKKIKDTPATVKMSFDNNKLEIMNVPKSCTNKEVYREVSKIIGEGLESIFFVHSKEKKEDYKNCILTYDTHKNALEARKLVFDGFELFGKKTRVDWAVPEEKIKSKRLYFDFPETKLTKPELYEEITKLVKPRYILNIFLQCGTGYITFQNEYVAYECFKALKKVKIHGMQFQLSFSKFYDSLPEEKKSTTEHSDFNESQMTEGTYPTASFESNTSVDIAELSSMANSMNISSETPIPTLYSSNGATLMTAPSQNGATRAAGYPVFTESAVRLSHYSNGRYVLPVMNHSSEYGSLGTPEYSSFSSNDSSLVHSGSPEMLARPLFTSNGCNLMPPMTTTTSYEHPVPIQPVLNSPTMYFNQGMYQQQQIPNTQPINLGMTPNSLREMHQICGVPYPHPDHDYCGSEIRQNQYELPIRLIQLNSHLNNAPVHYYQMTQDFYNNLRRT